MPKKIDKEEFLDSFRVGKSKIKFYSIKKISKKFSNVSKWPFSMRILLESLIRNLNDVEVKQIDIERLLKWSAENVPEYDIPFIVSRVLMQDLTGVPAVVDIAAMRTYVSEHKMDPNVIKPQMPINLIIDHSVQVDSYANSKSLEINQRREIERNSERYMLLKWAGGAFENFSVVPPSGGICHQVNLEHIASCVSVSKIDHNTMAFPDTLVGTDSHTTMINGLGVLGYGVGGIEAEAALLGQPVALNIPTVVGVMLFGRLNEGSTAMDLALTLTKRLREMGVVNAFVEFFGDGVLSLSLPDRATISNMCPEYGATISIFPVDDETIRYMRSTGRDEKHLRIIKKYYSAQGMFCMDYSKVKFNALLKIDLGSIEPCVSGPSQPKQKVELGKIEQSFDFAMSSKLNLMQSKNPSRHDVERWAWEKGAALPSSSKKAQSKAKSYELKNGDVVISAITSCTNTSNPFAMVGAAIMAKNIISLGMRIPPHVKTSFAPGSRVVVDYLKRANLMKYLDKLGYNVVGYGCTTCIGNSGPLEDWVASEIRKKNLSVASVLSGNRNYEARIHNQVAANYLMSPMLVIAFGLAGTINIDMNKDPLGAGRGGKPIYLKDIWPSNKQIYSVIKNTISPKMFKKEYKRIFGVNQYWNTLKSPKGKNYSWDTNSTYIRLPPFFNNFEDNYDGQIKNIDNAYALAAFGDSLSTDHISPAGAIPFDSPAGKYLLGCNVSSNDFNTYGARRGNHEVMMRSTFANVKIRNLMVEKDGGFTLHMPYKKEMSIYDAAMLYKKEHIPLIVFGGAEYGSGSSRDWAAKGPMLLGVRAVVAKSFERIHRSNLIGMGIMPFQFAKGEGFVELGVDPSKKISLIIEGKLAPNSRIKMIYYKKGNTDKSYTTLTSRIDSELELDYIKSGGVLRYVLKRVCSSNR